MTKKNPLVIDFSETNVERGGVCLDTHSAPQNMDNQFHDFKIKVTTRSNLPKCPITSIVNDFWAPDWATYTHSYNYNYSVTINVDPKASYMTEKPQLEAYRIKDYYKNILVKRLKHALTLMIEKKLCKNILCVIEYGAAMTTYKQDKDFASNYYWTKKPHFHLLVECHRINKLKALLEQVFETTLNDYYMPSKTGKISFKRGPINRIRPKVKNPLYDKRTPQDKVKEVQDSIDYIVYKYFKKEIKDIGENLLFNYLTNP
jgi:hypothetical protein